MRGALSYNEKKISAGKAELIFASRFGCELSDLGFTEKLNRFERLNGLCPKVKTNTLHLSINFSPYDNVDKEKMQAIALDYMKRIGFGDQPFLVYKHSDTRHPHIHIIASIIQPNGRPINMHNIGRLKSEPARKAMEKEYDLVPAESQKRDIRHPLAKTSLTNVIKEVTSSYHFTTLEELNAILKSFNAVADPGLPGSRVKINNGLLYYKLDSSGNKEGAPVKASAIDTKPTIAFLEKKFEKEITRKKLYVSRTQKTVAGILLKSNHITELRFRRLLANRGIDCQFIKDEDGRLDILLVDHFNKVVLNSKDINVSMDSLAERIIDKHYTPTLVGHKHKREPANEQVKEISEGTIKLFKSVLEGNHVDTRIPSVFLKKKKKKRRPGA